ncbi:Oxygen-insensitive NADPH nitroreductase [Mucinivorans hirudinis]|uniref:Oxygen-insensitive NADPH nitroreductase n=1 Tax=Mucinivorans hirudinis TaxID=1433126 RepID=A0A060R9G0_9BACT|nr:Oxygen-insensitive NADPH nitroreductase [Mucinivorans hirudinis]
MIKAIATHRTIRAFSERKIDNNILDEILVAASRASTTGGMQLYSMVVTQSDQGKELLSPCHFNQPCVRQAGAVVTFCADVNRFTQWCLQRGAEPDYHNFMWWVNAAIDALLASENFALEAENQGLGIVYLGTTTYTARRIIEILELPRGVVPVTTVAVGYPSVNPPLTPRLPMEAVVQYERYTPFTSEKIDELYSEMENSDFTKKLLDENGLENLAKIFTERRYKGEDSLKFSKEYFEVLAQQGFIEF